MKRRRKKWDFGDLATTERIGVTCKIIDLDDKEACLVETGGDPMTAPRHLASLDELQSPEAKPGEIELNDDERRAIAALTRLAKKWPKNLWILTNGFALYVMRCNEKGERAESPTKGYDPNYVVAAISIPCDGGDW